MKEKLLNAKAEIGTIVKDASNPHFKMKYASLPKILETINPILKAYGLLLTIEVTMDKELTSILNNPIYNGVVTVYDVETKLFESYHYNFPQDTAQKQNAIQAFGSTMTYAQRYMLGCLLGIPFDEEDPDNEKNFKKETKTFEPPKQSNNSPALVTEKQIAWLKKEVEERDISGKKALEIIGKYGYSSKESIKQKDFNRIMEDIKNV